MRVLPGNGLISCATRCENRTIHHMVELCGRHSMELKILVSSVRFTLAAHQDSAVISRMFSKQLPAQSH